MSSPGPPRRLDVVLVALGGGALAGGVGYDARALADEVAVIGILRPVTHTGP